MFFKKDISVFNFWIFTVGLAVIIVMAYNFFKPTLKVKEKPTNEHSDFKVPGFNSGDCFLVSKVGESLHPHYIQVVEKDIKSKEFVVLESIGNGKDKKVSIRINYYKELKSFENHRSSCPKYSVE